MTIREQIYESKVRVTTSKRYFADSVESDPVRYELDVDVTGMTKEEMLASEEFMSCFIYGGEHNYFFKKPNW